MLFEGYEYKIVEETFNQYMNGELDEELTFEDFRVLQLFSLSRLNMAEQYALDTCNEFTANDIEPEVWEELFEGKAHYKVAETHHGDTDSPVHISANAKRNIDSLNKAKGDKRDAINSHKAKESSRHLKKIIDHIHKHGTKSNGSISPKKTSDSTRHNAGSGQNRKGPETAADEEAHKRQIHHVYMSHDGSPSNHRVVYSPNRDGKGHTIHSISTSANKEHHGLKSIGKDKHEIVNIDPKGNKTRG